MNTHDKSTTSINWTRGGLIYRPSGDADWGVSHAQVPTVHAVGDNILRVFFGTRDSQNRTLPSFIDISADAPTEILHVHTRPVMALGKLGTFDDCGVMPSCVVNEGAFLRMYYTGWNTSTTVPYRNSIGSAISSDNGLTFEKEWEGPLLDRNRQEPHFCATPFVMKDGHRYLMWYLSCRNWRTVNGRPEATYDIRVAESTDGIDWLRRYEPCIDRVDDDEAISRPWVERIGDRFLMWFSYRRIANYRDRSPDSYRIGFAESDDGIHFQRCDKLAGLSTSENGWDCEMVAYPCVYRSPHAWLMLYNGNKFGADGFGYAVSRNGA